MRVSVALVGLVVAVVAGGATPTGGARPKMLESETPVTVSGNDGEWQYAFDASDSQWIGLEVELRIHFQSMTFPRNTTLSVGVRDPISGKELVWQDERSAPLQRIMLYPKSVLPQPEPGNGTESAVVVRKAAPNVFVNGVYGISVTNKYDTLEFQIEVRGVRRGCLMAGGGGYMGLRALNATTLEVRIESAVAIAPEPDGTGDVPVAPAVEYSVYFEQAGQEPNVIKSKVLDVESISKAKRGVTDPGVVSVFRNWTQSSIVFNFTVMGFEADVHYFMSILVSDPTGGYCPGLTVPVVFTITSNNKLFLLIVGIFFIAICAPVIITSMGLLSTVGMRMLGIQPETGRGPGAAEQDQISLAALLSLLGGETGPGINDVQPTPLVPFYVVEVEAGTNRVLKSGPRSPRRGAPLRYGDRRQGRFSQVQDIELSEMDVSLLSSDSGSESTSDSGQSPWSSEDGRDQSDGTTAANSGHQTARQPIYSVNPPS